MNAASVSFYRRAEDALADAALSAKVQRATSRLLASRELGFGAFAGSDAVRDRAQAVRADVVAHLDRYLAQFAAGVEARGGQVHWADTADDARRIVGEIAACARGAARCQIEVDDQ